MPPFPLHFFVLMGVISIGHHNVSLLNLDTPSEAFRRLLTPGCYSRKSLPIDPTGQENETQSPIFHTYQYVEWVWKDSNRKLKVKGRHFILYFYSPFNCVSRDSVLTKDKQSTGGWQTLADGAPAQEEERWQVGLCGLRKDRVGVLAYANGLFWEREKKKCVLFVLLTQNLGRCLLHRSFHINHLRQIKVIKTTSDWKARARTSHRVSTVNS